MRTHSPFYFVFFVVLSFIGACADKVENETPMSLKSAPLTYGEPGTACDDVNGSSVACYTGSAGTKGVGVCKAGLQFCINGKRGQCQGQVVPSDEVCDNKDNDCDSKVDEDMAGDPLVQVCYYGPDGTVGHGLCQAGSQVCSDGAFGDCIGQVLPGPETCDNQDNDCNDQVDENATGSPLTADCYTGPDGTSGVGLCKSGTKTCADGSFGTCNGEVVPVSDVCDGLDNDCDGKADEDFSNLTKACTVGIGACAKTGVYICNTAKNGEICSVTAGDPTDEVCDGVDNDCDNMTDENADGFVLTQVCYSGADGTAGVGLCKSGLKTCKNGSFGDCVGEVTPSDEVCDGDDNDCDSLTDEDSNGNTISVACYTGSAGTKGVGVCVEGTSSCCGGGMGPCVGQVLPSIEECTDKADNDCDGTTDSDCKIPCFDNDGDKYGDGCALGSDCDDSKKAVNSASPEWCGDSVDNDCDGYVDEGGCYSTASGMVLVTVALTGECVMTDLYLYHDFKGSTKDTFDIFASNDGASGEKITFVVNKAVDGLHRMNLEFDNDGDEGGDLTLVNGDIGSSTLHDECADVHVYYKGIEVEWVHTMDPRTFYEPFQNANAFMCFGSSSSCYLCGGDWDEDATPDCLEGASYCSADPRDSYECK